jgi:hypothetical protein
MTDPSTPFEFIALYVILFGSMLPYITLIHFASAKHWRGWFKLDEFHPPPILLGPMTFALTTFSAHAIGAAGSYLYWQEAQDLSTLYAEGLSPTLGFDKTLYWWASLIWIFRIYLMSTSYYLFWEFQAFRTCMFLSALALGSVVVETIFYYLMWWLPGLLLTFTAVFYLYNFVIGVSFSATHTTKAEYGGSYLLDPISFILKKIEHVKLPPVPSLRVNRPRPRQ